MPERTSLYQVAQFGVESTPGTGVATTKQLLSLTIDVDPQIEVSTYRPSGYAVATVAALNKEWVEAGISGPITYTDIVYLLSSILKTGVVTGAGNAKTWTFEPVVTAVNTPVTYTIEYGGAQRAHEFYYGLLRDLTLNFSHDECTLDGVFLGTALADGITMTAGNTAVALVPVLPTQVSVKLAATAAGLSGASASTRVLSASLSIANRYDLVWVLNAANSSYVAHVDVEPTIEMKLMMEADSAGMALLTTLRSATTQFVRVEAVGAAISGGGNYTLTCDFAGKLSDASEFRDEDGVYAIEWTLSNVYDATWTKSLSVVVINELAAL